MASFVSCLLSFFSSFLISLLFSFLPLIFCFLLVSFKLLQNEQFRKLNTLQILFEKCISMTVLQLWRDLTIIFIFLFFKAKTIYFFIVYYLRI